MPEFIKIFFDLLWWKSISKDESRDDYVTFDDIEFNQNTQNTNDAG